jgi:hypothetical protein
VGGSSGWPGRARRTKKTESLGGTDGVGALHSSPALRHRARKHNKNKSLWRREAKLIDEPTREAESSPEALEAKPGSGWLRARVTTEKRDTTAMVGADPRRTKRLSSHSRRRKQPLARRSTIARLLAVAVVVLLPGPAG